MRITFVFPYNTWGGAFRSTYSLGRELMKIGHDVEVIYPAWEPEAYGDEKLASRVYKRMWSITRALIRGTRVPVEATVRRRLIPYIGNTWIKNSDIIVANHWSTIKSVEELDESKGTKYVYIRDIEQWASYYKKEIELFKGPIKKICTSQWIKEFLQQKHEIEVNAVIGNGTDISMYCLKKEKPSNGRITLGMCYGYHPMKGCRYGIKALEAISKRNDIEIILFGFRRPKHKFKFKYEWINRPTGERLRETYRRINILISPAIQEGFGNVPCEAMAAKCAVITTKTGYMGEIAKDNTNCIVVNKENSEEIEKKIVYLIENQKIMREVAEKGYREIINNRWETKAKEFSDMLDENIDSRNH